MAQSGLPNLKWCAKGVERGGITMAESMAAALQPEFLQNWFQHPLGEVFRFEPLTFCSKEQRFIRTAAPHVNS